MKFRFLQYFFPAFALLSGLFFVSSVQAKELVTETKLNATTVQKGYTVKTPDGEFAVGVLPNAADIPIAVTIKKMANEELASAPEGFTRLGSAYEFDVLATDGTTVRLSAKQFNLKFKIGAGVGDVYKKKILFFWDRNQKLWRPIRSSKEDLKTREVTGYVPFGFATIGVFESSSSVEGWGSWYNYQLASNRAKYANGIATHIYPLGTTVKVTNLENGKSVQAKVVSTWDTQTNVNRRRAADIVLASFSKLGNPRQGIIPIRIEPVAVGSDQEAATSVPTAPVPTAPVSSTSGLTIKSRAAVVLDQSGNVLFAKNADKTYPVASLSKLFTAAAFLDTNPDWTKQVTLTSSDDAIGAKLFSVPGDIVTVKDLFHSTLTGSTNNGAKALARSTGLSAEEFVQRMNNKAISAGLTQTKFYEPTGLDPRNVSTAKEIARFSLTSINRVEILQGTTRSVYSFDEVFSADKQIHHDVKSTNILLSESHPYTILSSKTGYLDEALYCLMMKVRSKKDGKIYVAVLLGSSSSTVRFSEMRALLAKFVP